MSQISIRVENITKVFKTGKVGLHPCSFEIESNTLTAIMGPSGCGKSTLLKALMGDSPRTSGSIYIEGLELNEDNYDYIKTHIGYVPQDDIVHKDLTVEQCLTYSARLRLSDYSIKKQNIRVQEVLLELGINGIKDQLISEISGGQRKRVAIGVEILTKPKVLFLDEPTSPLDPQTIEEFLKILKTLAKSGTTVLMVTHKPEDLVFMDDCIFMGVGGYITYKGNPNNLTNYFDKEHIVEVYSLMDSNEKVSYYNKFITMMKTLSIIETNKTKFNPNRHTNFISQTFWLITRYLSRKLNDIETLVIQLSQAPIIALLVILIFKEVDQIVLFFIVISAIWFGTNNAAKEIVSESNIFKRERMYNQGIIPYLISKIFVLSIIGFIQSAIFILILSEKYKSASVQLENPTTLILWMFLITVVSSLFGLALSAISATTEKVMGLIPIALIPQIMFSGVMVKMTAVFVKIPSFIVISRWSMTGISRLQTNVYDNLTKSKVLSLDVLKENLGETYDQYNSIQLELYVLTLQVFFFFTLIYLILRDRYNN
jgi:ABC-type multidrug transport system ATPase subunit